jgi:hypothetical protein
MPAKQFDFKRTASSEGVLTLNGKFKLTIKATLAKLVLQTIEQYS